MDSENVEEIFMQHGVILKKAAASCLPALATAGVLSFCRYTKGSVHFFEWKQSEIFEIMDTDSQDQDSGWSLVHTPSAAGGGADKANDSKGAAENDLQRSNKITLHVLFRDLLGIETTRSGELRFYNKDKTVHSAYEFSHGSPQSFVDFLDRKRLLRRSSRRKQFYHCLEETDNDKLQKSFSELNIEDIRNRPRPTNPYIDFMTKLASVHYQILPSSKPQPAEEHRSRISPPQEMDAEERNGSLEEGNDKIDSDGGAEGKASGGGDGNVRKLAPRPDVHRGPPLSAKQWAEFRAPNGSISDPQRVKEIIFRGGIEDNIRADVWKYLLGLDIWEHSTAQRDERRVSKTEEYFLMKLQWQTITPVQENNFTGYRERKCQIEKDVKRTDRTYDFFAGDDNPNLAKLQEILMTYVMYNFDLGYVQGMSDLLAPILCLVQNQAESFWCFVGFMQKVFSNFDIDQKGMKLQLEHLRTLLAFVNEKLYNYMMENQSENMYFCFRWLLVWFKREFSNSDIMHLWEVLWTNLPCPNFHLFICVAILDQEMDVFIDGQFSFTEILKHVNELSGNLNVTAILEQAESIYLQVKKTLETSKEPLVELRKIIGEEVVGANGSNGGGSTGSDEDDDSCMSIVNDKSPDEEELMQRKLEEACDLSLSFGFL